jgi:hypothetical protein
MRRTLAVFVVAASIAFALMAVRGYLAKPRFPFPQSAQAGRTAPSQADALHAYGKLPLIFDQNAGQTDGSVRFLARGAGYTVFLTDRDATLRLDRASTASFKRKGRALDVRNTEEGHAAVVRMSLAYANPRPEVHGLEPQSGQSHYFIGNDPRKWRRNVPQFGRVKYREIYPGIDLIYYGNQRQLESDYVVAPGADASRIALQIAGADCLAVNSQGDLVVSTRAGEVFLRRPRAYQTSGSARQEIAANYVPSGDNLVHIHVASYDRGQPLIIDPVLSYSTYLGGSLNQALLGIAVDSTGFAYITGSTSSTDFPVTAGSLQTTAKNSKSSAFVTKLKQDGTGLVYSTLIGGSGASGDSARAIAVNSSGNAYIVGSTSSTDFPVTPANAYQTINKGGGGFFTELDPAGANLVYSTYLSGSGSDRPEAVAVDTAGNAYITGATTSTDFPVIAGTAIQTTNNVTGSQIGTAFLSRIDPTKVGAGSLVYSTYIGGSKQESGLGVAVDGSANAYITGSTLSPDFPMPASKNGFQTTLLNTSGGNAFVAKVDTSQPNHLVYSTFLGGAPNGFGGNPGEVGSGIALGPSGDAYMIGYSYANDYPLVGAFDSVSNTPNQKTVVSRIDTTKSGAASLVYSTYFGGTRASLTSSAPGVDLGFGIAVDSAGNMYLVGTSRSVDFPVTPGAPQSAIAGTQNASMAKLNPAGSALLFATLLGGSIESANGVALDRASPPNAYITGVTAGNFPTTSGAFQTVDKVTGQNNTDGFVAKLSPGAVTGVFATPASLSFGSQPLNTTSAPKLVTLLNDTSAAITISGATITGTNAADFAQTTTCATTLAAAATCTYSVTFKPTVSGAESATLGIATSDASSPHNVALSGTGGGGTTPDFTLAVSPATATVTAGSSTTLTATLTSTNGFAGTVSLTCAGAPKDSTCTLAPTSVALSSGGTQTSTGTINTTARSMLTPPARLRTSPLNPTGLWSLLAIVLALLAAWSITRRSARRFVWGFAAIAALAVCGCSGVAHKGTPAGVYTLTVTATSGSLTHTATVSLTVN